MMSRATLPTECMRNRTRSHGVRTSLIRLSTILITESSRLAVINDKVYAVGDKIGGEEISKITLDHIVLTDNSQERVLRVPQPQTEVTVEDTGGK